MQSKLNELKNLLSEAYDLQYVLGLMDWDQATYMPPGGAHARARQLATVARLFQRKFSHPSIGRLLDDLLPYEESLPYDSDEASLIRVTRRDYERAVKVPPEFMGKYRNHIGETYQAWVAARSRNDFASVQPYLEKTLDLSRQLADFFPGYEHIADPLINISDYGMTASRIRALFAELRSQMQPLMQTIIDQPLIDDACLYQTFPEADQVAFGEQIIRVMGYDFDRGRIDKTYHPFMVKFAIGDVRITTRVREDFLGELLFSLMHEAGHALYEQGIDATFEATPLDGGASAGMHESQSRLWENFVGSSLPFWRHFYPQLQQVFPDQLGSLPLEAFYAAINKVERSLIRTDADEVTYNLHIMLRFNLELELLEGSLAVRDLPEAWNERYRRDLGIAPTDHRDGVLQDMHWFSGPIGGAFQGYTLGNILGAQIYQTALQAHPEITDEIERGEFSTLRAWLKENVYRHGRKFTTSEMIERLTGGPVSIAPYLQYLEQKYGELYSIHPIGVRN